MAHQTENQGDDEASVQGTWLGNCSKDEQKPYGGQIGGSRAW
jgi:hypothetical protein